MSDRGDYQGHDDPALAFDRLRGEVALLRSAIEGIASARESIEIPDYEPTLARTEGVLKVLVRQMEAMSQSPAFKLGPDQMAQEIVSAALHARREDQRIITEARTALDQAAREIAAPPRVGAAGRRSEPLAAMDRVGRPGAGVAALRNAGGAVRADDAG